MSRPSRNTDQLLLQAGRALLPESGIRDLSLRKVAAKAGVNLGMFHYHFKTKRVFVRRVLQEIYEEFFSKFHLESSGPGSSLERLKRAVTALAHFARDNRKLFMMLLREALNGERTSIEFAKQNIPRHAGVILRLLKECQKKDELSSLPLPVAMSFLMGAVMVPNTVVTLLQRVGSRRPFGLGLKELEQMFLSDSAIDLRIALVLKALRKR